MEKFGLTFKGCLLLLLALMIGCGGEVGESNEQRQVPSLKLKSIQGSELNGLPSLVNDSLTSLLLYLQDSVSGVIKEYELVEKRQFSGARLIGTDDRIVFRKRSSVELSNGNDTVKYYLGAFRITEKTIDQLNLIGTDDTIVFLQSPPFDSTVLPAADYTINGVLVGNDSLISGITNISNFRNTQISTPSDRVLMLLKNHSLFILVDSSESRVNAISFKGYQ